MKWLSKKHLILFIGLFLSLVLVCGYILKNNPSYYYKAKAYIRRLIKPKIKNTFYVSELNRDDYSLHRKTAKSNGNIIVKDNNINKLIESGKLVKVESCNGFKINKLTHSKSILTPECFNILKLIGADFAKKTNRNDFFVITSLTRTIESQRRLSKSNKNATRNISTHSYGVSFDISYTRFNAKRGHNARLQKILEDILISYQKKKKIYVLMEKKSTCYHITVRE